MNKTEARRLARARHAQIRAEREEAERKRREEAERKQAARDEANENDLVDYFQAEALIEESRRKHDELVAEKQAEMSAAVVRLWERERNVKTVAELLGVTPSRVSAMRKAAERDASAESSQPTGDPVQPRSSSPVEGDDPSAHDEMRAQEPSPVDVQGAAVASSSSDPASAFSG